jgi:hypothetical protein
MPFAAAALRSTWSEPTPAVTLLLLKTKSRSEIIVKMSHIFRDRLPELEVLGLFDKFSSQVAGVEGSRD